ncbi:hypothetical protein V6N12_014820 [Hibiscus sabdariffa]|uniref:Uncharacterized protein n=1 Tax=Hibiscus sabdariffa TaxID=183260 RepID=A0ABR2DLA7_9ROSI
MGPVRPFKRIKKAAVKKVVDHNVLHSSSAIVASSLGSQPRPLDWWDEFSQRISGCAVGWCWPCFSYPSSCGLLAWPLWLFPRDDGFVCVAFSCVWRVLRELQPTSRKMKSWSNIVTIASSILPDHPNCAWNLTMNIEVHITILVILVHSRNSDSPIPVIPFLFVTSKVVALASAIEFSIFLFISHQRNASSSEILAVLCMIFWGTATFGFCYDSIAIDFS